MTTMEDLTKTQIVLLALLVSFITSIATGIITTSLLAQAPQAVTQTIDRVVERTIERVSPNGENAGTVREITIVREDDAITSAIEGNLRSVVRISSPGDSGFYALGVILSKSGFILSDKRGSLVMGAPYNVTFSDGSVLPANVYKSGENGLVLFRLQAEEARLKGLSVASVGKSDPKLGQTVVVIQGQSDTTVSVGRVLSINSVEGRVLTDMSASMETEGSPLLNLSGEVVGLKISNADLSLPAGSYILSSELAKFVAEVL